MQSMCDRGDKVIYRVNRKEGEREGGQSAKVNSTRFHVA
jgi:hypothetical protein